MNPTPLRSHAIINLKSLSGKMRIAAVILSAAAATSAISASGTVSDDGSNNFSGKSWISSVPPRSKSEWKPIREKEVYEVVSSKLLTAVVRDLATKTFIPITKETAEYYTGHYYQCENGKHPYLVRAVYEQGATGSYAVFERDRSILVSHSGLGPGGKYHKSALIVNLDFEPGEAYIEAMSSR